ncbi:MULTISPECIES: hypothetical protein [Pseudoalteromonas]|uniref:O-antigen ligase like membrane protein n=1 Tax=Pseudoalteromonas luteoviolacea (strain 2ta16) TaxID=1353533 RepID=V4HWC9_PSEL2|nr:MULTISPECIES: hypothetical protein [Pseudoalteromonas]ESP95130.1 hypothetical protein PL2TA16_04386 [Pseudoalteromonas luteoviolacea 2ta16]KZN42304.1 hypothetical protein N483_12335 [Pseudoalteromonas luteoviolacea NCIMB 1944]MCG7547200.1 hypothetical protein [Pseudoalteromonas sp. Of7M-16]
MKYALFFNSLIFISPICAYYLGGAKLPTLFIALVTIVYLVFGLRKINIYAGFYPMLAVFLLFSVSALYWQDMRVVSVPIYFYVALLLGSVCTRDDVSDFVDLASYFMLFLCIGAVLSMFYVVLGGGPIFTFPNPDGRLNYVFFGTMTNSYWSGLIRPSGIFDEPGAFSFFICAVVTLRKIYNKSNNISWALLVLGMCTLSIAHVVFVIFYFLSERPDTRRILVMFLILFLSFLLIKNSSSFELFQQVFLNRFQIGDDGMMKGDNRSESIFAAIEILMNNSKVIIWGLSPDSYLNSVEYMRSSGLPEIGSNPLSQLVRMGLLLSCVYYTVLLILFSTVRKGAKYLAVVGFGMLLLQRDFIYVVSYSMFVVLIVRASMNIETNKNIESQ